MIFMVRPGKIPNPKGGIMTDRPRLTTTAGAPLSSNQNSKTVGEHGPVLLEDYQLIE